MAKPKKAKTGERRASRRIQVSLPLVVRGVDKHGAAFEDAAESYDLSREGASFSTTRELVVGQQVEVGIPRRPGPAPRGGPGNFETTGEVRRITSKKEGEWEIGVHFTGPRLRVYIPESS